MRWGVIIADTLCLAFLLALGIMDITNESWWLAGLMTFGVILIGAHLWVELNRGRWK